MPILSPHLAVVILALFIFPVCVIVSAVSVVAPVSVTPCAVSDDGTFITLVAVTSSTFFPVASTINVTGNDGSSVSGTATVTGNDVSRPAVTAATTVDFATAMVAVIPLIFAGVAATDVLAAAVLYRLVSKMMVIKHMMLVIKMGWR